MDKRERAIRSLLPLVKKIARRVRTMIPGVDYGDLIGDGSIGAIRAVDGFDRMRGNTLETYARRLILGHMLNGLRRLDPLPERTRRELRDAEEQRYALALAQNRVPALSEMYALRPKFRRAYERMRAFKMYSLDCQLPEGIDPPLDREADPASIMLMHAERSRMQRWIARLPYLQQQVLHLHYFADTTIRDIAQKLATTPQHASKLHMDAIRQLRSTQHASPNY